MTDNTIPMDSHTVQFTSTQYHTDIWAEGIIKVDKGVRLSDFLKNKQFVIIEVGEQQLHVPLVSVIINLGKI